MQKQSYSQPLTSTSWLAPPRPEPTRPPIRKKHISNKILIGLTLCAIILAAAGILSFLFNQGDTPPTTTRPHPTPVPTLTAHQRYQQLARQYLNKMSEDELLGQLFMVQYTDSDYSDDLEQMISQEHVGGVIMYQSRDATLAHQLRTKEQATADITRMQSHAKIPLFIGIDEEGWNVDRLWSIYPTKRPSADDIHLSGNTTFAAEQGKAVAQDMLALGINTNFAPDLDVGVPDQYIDNDYRSFGSTAADVVKYAGPYLQSMQQAGVVGAVKHFPGIGSVPYGIDPHATLPTVSHTRQEVYDIDLAPFKQLIQSNKPDQAPGMVMTTYVMVPSIDTTMQAQYSSILITDILRKEFGYDGVIVTDSLTMDGGAYVNGTWISMAERALLSLKAGNDLLLGVPNPENLATIIAALKDAINNGTLTLERVKQSVERILTLKLERGIMQSQ